MKSKVFHLFFNLFSLCSLLILLIPDFVSAQIFTKINVPGLSNSRARGFGSAFFDYNNDGKLDILVANYDSKCQLFKNNGNDSFTEIVNNNITSTITPGSSGLTLGDYDNDGKNDLYLLTYSGTGLLFNKAGDSTYSLINNHPMTKLSGFITHCTWGDYDNDGLLDMFIPACESSAFVKGTGVKNYLFHNEGDGKFVPVTNSAPVNTIGNNVSANFCDIDNDGDLDLFMTDCQVDNHLYENVDGVFTEIAIGQFPNQNSSISCSWGDYDNDGFMDLFIANGRPLEGVYYPTYLYHNNGNKTFTKITTGPLADFRGNGWNGLWADFDNDGDLDLFVGTYSQPDVLFINNGDGTFAKDSSEFDMSSKGTSGASFGDYNNDGFLDLFTENNYGLGHLLYKNKGNDNHWIFIDCEGTLSNRSAIGARVRIKATISGKSFWQVREINSNMGFRGVSELRAHFGLGDATVIDSLIIDWPSKSRTIKTNIPVNQSLKVKEDVPLNYLQPGFKADIKTGFSPLVVKFSDLSVCNESNPITAWSWDFDGDGKEDSNEKNPSHTYYCYEGKKYNISLTVTAGTAKKTIAKDSLIDVTALYLQNVALQKKAEVSSVSVRPATVAANLIDGLGSTYWQSANPDSEWIKIELDSTYSVGKVVIKWGTYYAKQYKIQYSKDGSNWSDLMQNDNGKGGNDTIKIKATQIKSIKLLLDVCSSTTTGFRINEIEVYRPESLTDPTIYVEDPKLTPSCFNLLQNYPNPFNPETVISYQIPASLYASQRGTLAPVILKVFDLLGREVAVLVNKEQTAGNYQVKFDGSNLTSGIYFYTLNVGDNFLTKKMCLLK